MNALQSWLRIQPGEIILFGNEEGCAEAASRLRLRHIPEIARNDQGTPLISSLFEEAQKIAAHPILCYLNADIILLSDFREAVQRIRQEKFLMVGRRWNLEVSHPVNFEDPAWESALRAAVLERGELEKPDGLDYFVFPKGTLFDIPPFTVGRPGWDNWMIYRARRLGLAVIDATPSVTAVHQIHDYSHHPQGKEGVWKGPEARTNLRLLGGESYAFTLWDATRILKPDGLGWALTAVHLKRRLETLTVLYPKGSLRSAGLRWVFSITIRLYLFLSRHPAGWALAVLRKLRWIRS